MIDKVYGKIIINRRLFLYLLILAFLVLGVIYFLSTRALAATFTVNSTGDAADFLTSDGVCETASGNGVCTLRAAIQEANSLAGTDTINFNIAGAGPHTITVGSELPSINETTIVDGSSQSGSSCGDLWGGVAPVWKIIITNPSPGAVSYSGFGVGANNSSVRGLKITGFADGSLTTPPGLDIGGDNITVTCNHLDDNGKGIRVGGANDIIGGDAAGEGNLITGSEAEGIPAVGATGILIQGNFIGVNVAGTAGDSNGAGIALEGTADAIIGGTTTRAANLIRDGIIVQASPGLTDGATSSVIQGNFLGTDINGVSLAGGNSRILVEDAIDTAIGGLDAGEGNIIGNAGGEGVMIENDSTRTTVQGNRIFGCMGAGVNVEAGSTDNIIQGNTIGLNLAGTAALGCAGGVDDNGTNTLIGGTTIGTGNVIAGNNNPSPGINLNGSGALVQGNYIGTNAAGTVAIANAYGIAVNTSGNTIGGTAAGARNIISGNTNSGIRVASGTGNSIQGNYIGTNAAGTAALANGEGISDIGTGTIIGGTAAGSGNVISGHDGWAFAVNLRLSGSGAVVQGNYIGTNAAGTAALSNSIGIYIETSSHTIGGTTSAARNVIAGNTQGILLVDTGSGVNSNTVQGNYIGVGSDGTTAVANTAYGIIMVGSGTVNNTIGGTASGAGNTIANNGSGGVSTYDISGALGPPGTGNAILGNAIYSNTLLGIDLSSAMSPTASEGVTANDTGDSDTGPNNFQNYPVITAATTDGVTTTVTGTLNSVASNSFRLEFFSTATADGSGYGEGQTYLGTTTVTTNGSGTASFTATGLTATTVGYAITATASQDLGSSRYSTSEFSAVYAATVPASSSSSSSSGGTTFPPGFFTNVPFTPTTPPPTTTPTQPTLPPLSTLYDPASEILFRDLDLERAAIVIFVSLFRRLPTLDADWTAVNHLAYGNRIERNLVVEGFGLHSFTQRFLRLPETTADWLTVHVLGFVSVNISSLKVLIAMIGQ